MIVFLDSNVLIYLIEGDPNLAARVKESIVEQEEKNIQTLEHLESFGL